jgi:dephospho-CoA kinase
MARIHKIGLTGGIGSGKSTVAQMLSALGAMVIDADALAHSVTLAGGAAIGPIAAQFGASFIAADGSLDRPRMREKVFAEPDAKRRLEAIIHPLVQQQTEQQAEQAAQRGCHCMVFDVPLLVESMRWRSRVDLVLVVDCLSATQMARVTARSALERAAVEKIMLSQATRAQRLRAADVVIFNEGLTIEQLRHEVGETAVHFGL